MPPHNKNMVKKSKKLISFSNDIKYNLGVCCEFYEEETTKSIIGIFIATPHYYSVIKPKNDTVLVIQKVPTELKLHKEELIEDTNNIYQFMKILCKECKSLYKEELKNDIYNLSPQEYTKALLRYGQPLGTERDKFVNILLYIADTMVFNNYESA